MNSINPRSWPQHEKEKIYNDIGNPMDTENIITTLEHAIQLLDIARMGHILNPDEMQQSLHEMRLVRKELILLNGQEKQRKYQEQRLQIKSQNNFVEMGRE